MIDNRPPIDTGMLEIERLHAEVGMPAPFGDYEITFVEVPQPCWKLVREGFCDLGMTTVGGWVRHWHRVEA